MNTRTLITLFVALLVLTALAIAVSLSQRPMSGSGGMLLPGLRAQLNSVDQVVIRAGGNRVVATLEKKADRWTLAERNGYPADVGRIRRNLIALAEAVVLEEKTSNPELYERLGVEDIAGETAGGLQFDLGSGGAVTSVIIGSTGVGGGDRAYARRPAEPVSWLVSGEFDAPRETSQWLDRLVTDIDSGRIQAVTIRHPEGDELRIERETAATGDFSVASIPRGRELSFPGAANTIGSALAGLELENVEPAGTFDPGEVKPVVARFGTFDGLVVEASTWKLPAGARVRFLASVDEALAARFASAEAGAAGDAVPEGGDTDSGTAARKSLEEVRAEA
ncbi:MAG: DUF4340 domain-containing protein, partial [Gammaproteobacteria bacterium]|nr:DUF4340 domain-containing protein [Gammaproteobacteria bacterium]